MTVLAKGAAAAFALALLPVAAQAADAVKRIDVYVEPYYAAARSAKETPEVHVGKTFDALLASPKQADILAARDKVLAAPKLVTPMTMMVLAIRLYDTGLRDDAVFWFYVAKDRYITLGDVADLDSNGLRQVEDAIRNFSTLAGPVINGYAFCDIANQQAIRARELDWVEANPYDAVFLPQIPAVVLDRDAGLKASVAGIRASAAKETAYFADPANLASFKASRTKNDMNAKFCWK